jgi:hypothetical protein
MTFNQDEDDIFSVGYSSTGDHDIFEETKIVTYPFDRYLIKVQLDFANRFLGIIEVKLNKQFLSYEQKRTIQKYHDVDEFYED